MNTRLCTALWTILYLALALPLGAQDTAAVKALATRDSVDAVRAYNASRSSTVRAAARRIMARTDSINRALRVVTQPIPVPPPIDPVKPTPVDTAKDSVIVTPGPGPGPVLFSHPYGLMANGAVLATLPQDTVSAQPPAVTRVVSCTALQVCYDTAKTGDALELAPGSVHGVVRFGPTARTGWVTIRTRRTSLGGPWERMTPAQASSLNLATIRSTSTDEPVVFTSGAHHVWLSDVRVTTTSPTTNALVRIGQGESVVSLLPTDIALVRVVIDGGTNDVRRCIVMDGARLAVLSSTLANCHSRGGDAQGILSINGKGPFRIENNAIQGSHQAIMFGGGDPAIRGQVPADGVIRRNDLTRPFAWKAAGWPAKTVLELKLGKRVLVEGNVIAGSYADLQAGFGVLLKTENQNGGLEGDWSETSDITVRYNRVEKAAGAFNLSALAAGPGVPMSRVSIYRNAMDSICVGNYACDGAGDGMQHMGVNDVVFLDNWVRNPLGRSCVYVPYGGSRVVIQRNVCGGLYGIKIDPGAVNFLVGSNTLVAPGTAFSAWPVVPPDSTRDALLQGVTPAP